MLGIFGTQGGRPQRRHRHWQAGRPPRRESVHDRATQTEKSASPQRCYRSGERKLRVNWPVLLAFSVPKAGAARLALRPVVVVTAATSQHLSATDLLASALCFAVWLTTQTDLQQ